MLVNIVGPATKATQHWVPNIIPVDDNVTNDAAVGGREGTMAAPAAVTAVLMQVWLKSDWLLIQFTADLTTLEIIFRTLSV